MGIFFLCCLHTQVEIGRILPIHSLRLMEKAVVDTRGLMLDIGKRVPTTSCNPEHQHLVPGPRSCVSARSADFPAR